jgi:hypothetical protein
MYVVKRDGRKEAVSFDKITSRIKRLSWGLPNEFCDPVRPLAFAHALLRLFAHATMLPRSAHACCMPTPAH